MRIARSLLPLIALLPLMAAAQTATTTTIAGAVSDPQGSRVAAATVTLIEVATNQERVAVTDAAGRYSFYALNPGRYRVKIEAPGFKAVEVRDVTAEVSKVATINVAMELGEILIVQNIVAGAQSQLQTADGSVGGVFSQESLQKLPNASRQANTLFNLQPASTASGEFAGARQDQSTITLDGVDVSDNVRGEQGRTIIPAPLESIREFRSIVVNANATFGRSSGGQFALVTRSGGNEFHGSAYFYHQDNALAANSWTNNRIGIKRPFLLDNRFGATFGGPIVKDQTFFFAHYEGRRNPDSATVTRLVPTESFRNGTLRYRDYDFETRQYVVQTLTPADLKADDPRGLGVNPKVLEYLRLFPLPNDFSRGNGLNRAGFTFAYPTLTSDNFGSLRLDHEFSQRWNANAKFAANRHIETNATQVDLLRKMAAASSPQRPRNLTATLIGVLTPHLTNEARFSWLHDRRSLQTLAPRPFAGLDVALNIGTGIVIDKPDNLIDVEPLRARSQARTLNIYQWSDTLTWVRDGHNLQAGAHIRRIRSIDFRNDKVANVLATPVAELGGAPANIFIPGAQRPGFQFLNPELGELKRILWGQVSQVSLLFARDANLNLLPPGAGLRTRSTLKAWEFYFSDTWRWRPSLTLTYGLTYNWQPPPVEDEGKQTLLTFKETGQLVNYRQYMRDKLNAANEGRVYNPDLAFVPIRQSGRKTAYNTDYTNLSPRLSVAWNPAFKAGWLGRLFGEQRTVARGGYALVFDRANTVQTINIPTLGLGFSQTAVRRFPFDQPFRLGFDGPIPLPSAPASLIAPIAPIANLEEIVSFSVDPFIKTPRNHVVDFTLQRELPGELLLEAGYIGRFGRKLYANGNLNSAPFMQRDPRSGQTFAEAYDIILEARRRFLDPGPQPYFENLYGAGSTDYISSRHGYVSYLQQFYLDACAARAKGQTLPFPIFCQLEDGARAPIFTNLQVQDLWMRASVAESNYHGAFVALRQQYSRGLTFDLSYTFSRSLDNVPGLTQNDLTPFQSSFYPEIDYGPSLFDINHLFKFSGVYALPFGQGRWLSSRNAAINKLISGWFTAGIFTAQSGLPLTAILGSDGFGGSSVHNTFTGAIPLERSLFGKGVRSIVTGKDDAGRAGNPVNNCSEALNAICGTGLNLFPDPDLVFRNFRPVLLASDRRHGRGALRGLSRWNLDWTIGKEIKLKEKTRLSLSFDFFNVFNHVIFNDPNLDLRSDFDFGVLNSQFNRPRRIQVGARIEF
jgi:hypothetical protein